MSMIPSTWLAFTLGIIIFIFQTMGCVLHISQEQNACRAGRPQSAPDLSSQDNFLNQELRDGLNIVGELPYPSTLADEHDPSRGFKKPCTGQYKPRPPVRI
jgi:hypothetical protein